MAWDWDKLQQQKKGNQGGAPPQTDDVMAKIKEMKGKFSGSWIIIVIIVLIILGYSMLYKLQPNEVGVIQRFGEHVRTTSSGLHVKWPMGIEKMTKVPVGFVDKAEFGFRTTQPGVRTQYSASNSFLNESLMLTGDLNVAVVPWIVQFRIKEPDKYLFKVRNVTSTLRDLSESTMRQIVGDRSIDEIINKRAVIANEAKVLLQKELDEAETGIHISTIEMKKTTVPEPVQPSWNEVNQAGQEKEKMIYQAQEEYNKLIPQAKGQAEKTIKAAEGYALDRINRAEGDAARFSSIYNEYRNAKDITRRRLYLEALREIYPNLGDKFIVDANQKNLLPLLNLGQPLGGKK